MRLLLVSASCRAIAESAVAAGFSVSICDQFADWDLLQLASRTRSPRPSVKKIACFSEILGILNGLDCDAAILSGGFENRIQWVAELESRIQLLGPNSVQLARLQDPDELPRIAKVIFQSGGQFPETRMQYPIERSNEVWLKKSLRRSGGRQVEFANKEDEPSPSHYFQKYIQGRSLAGVFIAIRDPSQPETIRSYLIGCSVQLVGERWLGASQFSYCGSIGPSSLSEETFAIVRDIGAALAVEFGMTGVFGIDFIFDEQGVWPVDINPRIPASAEIFEIFFQESDEDTGLSILKAHVDACLGRDLLAPENDFKPLSETRAEFGNRIIGKAILFCRSAAGNFISHAVFARLVGLYHFEDVQSDKKKRPKHWVADIPNLGTLIKLGEPILSLYVTGESEELVYQLLIDFSGELRNLIESGNWGLDPQSPGA